LTDKKELLYVNILALKNWTILLKRRKEVVAFHKYDKGKEKN